MFSEKQRRDGGETAYCRRGEHRRHGALLGDHSEGLSRQDYQVPYQDYLEFFLSANISLIEC